VRAQLLTFVGILFSVNPLYIKADTLNHEQTLLVLSVYLALGNTSDGRAMNRRYLCRQYI
jgi:hypothetical protein